MNSKTKETDEERSERLKKQDEAEKEMAERYKNDKELVRLLFTATDAGQISKPRLIKAIAHQYRDILHRHNEFMRILKILWTINPDHEEFKKVPKEVIDGFKKQEESGDGDKKEITG